MKKKKLRKKAKSGLIVLLFCVLSAIGGFYIQRKKNYVNEYVKVVYKAVNTEVVNKASLVMVGDALIHMPINYARKTGSGYDFKGIFKYIKPIVQEYDSLKTFCIYLCKIDDLPTLLLPIIIILKIYSYLFSSSDIVVQ